MKIAAVSRNGHGGDIDDTERKGSGAIDCRYLSICVSISGLGAIVTILLWSSIGWGEDCLKSVQKAGVMYWYGSAASLIMILFALYMLDFFMPPHLPGRYLLLFEGDRCVGPALVTLAGASLYCVCLFMAEDRPSAPLLATLFLSPIAIAVLHSIVLPGGKDDASRTTDSDIDSSMRRLKKLSEEEERQRKFFIAASAAFLLIGMSCLAVWLPWAASRGHHLDEFREKTSGNELEVLYMVWSAPLIVGVTEICFAAVIVLRVYMSRSYTSTHKLRNQLLVDGYGHGEHNGHRTTLRKARVSNMFGKCREDYENMDEAKRQQYLKMHEKSMKDLMQVVRVIGCVLALNFGAVYVTFQLVAVDSHLADMAKNWLACISLFFIGFIFTAFRRLWNHLHVWLLESVLFHKAVEMARCMWFRGLCLGLALPLLPPILMLSMINQCVRRCRGLEDGAERDGEDRAGRHCLTKRIRDGLFAMRTWRWIPLIKWVYIWGVIIATLLVSPILLNVFLAAMSKVLEDVSFYVLVLITFLIGMCLFLLPPVPGAPIYFFAGALFTKACPWGFLVGTVISIVMGWLTKLGACAMQQKWIGEQLGERLWVRQTCGVHKPFIRTIECVLREPGWTIGKVAILCGGPDWPTSVLAGILKLSLWQCELGTFPIIFFIAPFSLSGSFYLKRDDGEIWNRAGNLMFTLTGVVWLILGLLMAWAWQKTFDEKQEFVTKPMKEYIELDWCDYCAARISESCDTSWSDVPRCLQAVFASGGIVIMLVCHMFLWGSYMCFGEFKVTDDISDLKWIGSDGLFKPIGVAAMSCAIVSCSGLAIFQAWEKRRTRETVQRAKSRLRDEEEIWKQRRLEEVLQYKPPIPAKAFDLPPIEHEPIPRPEPTPTMSPFNNALRKVSRVDGLNETAVLEQDTDHYVDANTEDEKVALKEAVDFNVLEKVTDSESGSNAVCKDVRPSVKSSDAPHPPKKVVRPKRTVKAKDKLGLKTIGTAFTSDDEAAGELDIAHDRISKPKEKPVESCSTALALNEETGGALDIAEDKMVTRDEESPKENANISNEVVVSLPSDDIVQSTSVHSEVPKKRVLRKKKKKACEGAVEEEFDDSALPDDRRSRASGDVPLEKPDLQIEPHAPLRSHLSGFQLDLDTPISLNRPLNPDAEELS